MPNFVAPKDGSKKSVKDGIAPKSSHEMRLIAEIQNVFLSYTPELKTAYALKSDVFRWVGCVSNSCSNAHSEWSFKPVTRHIVSVSALQLKG